MKNIFTLAIFITTLLFIGCKTKKGDTELASKPSTKINLIDYMDAYILNDKTYGTKTEVKITDGKRIMTTNALPNHKTGSFPNRGNPNTISAQNRTRKIPLNPVYTGKSKWAREPGVALNGVKFEPQTAERFICDTGERYSVEAVQDLLDMGLDFNNAHVQPTGEYHYHGVPTELVKLLDKGEDLVHVGFANDGFPIYYSKSGKYKPSFQLSQENRTGDICSYNRPGKKIEKELSGTKPDGTFVSDWEYVEGLGDLDECNGITINDKYIYLVTDDYPYVGRCLMGEFKGERHGPPPGGQRGERGEHRGGDRERPQHRHGNGPAHEH